MRPDVSHSETPQVQSVARALEVLKAFGRADEWGVSALAKELQLHKSVVHRFLTTLTAAGLLIRDDERRTYSLGVEFYRLARRAQKERPLAVIAKRYLVELADQTHETLSLGTLFGAAGICAANVDSPHSIRYTIGIGDSFSLHAAAIGKALLAFQPREFQESVLGGELPGYTEHTFVDSEQLRVELASIRVDGFAFSDGEVTAGARSVAAPVFGPDGSAVAALALTAPEVRLPVSLVPGIAKLVKAAADSLSADLGYQEVGSETGGG